MSLLEIRIIMHSIQSLHYLKCPFVFQLFGIKYFLSLFLLLNCFLLSGQSDLDSLYMIWEDENQKDSVRVTAFSSYIGKGFMRSNPDSAIILANELIAFGEIKNYCPAKVEGQIIVGVGLRRKDNFQKSKKYLSDAIKLSKDCSDSLGLANSKYYLGFTYKVTGDHDSALHYFNESKLLSEAIGNINRLGLSLGQIGKILTEIGQYEKALELYSELLALDQSIGNRNWIAADYRIIGDVYSDIGNRIRALEYYYKSLKLCEETGSKQEIARVSNQIAGVHVALGRYESAQEYYYKALQAIQEINNNSTQIPLHLLTNIGLTYSRLGDHEKAMEYFRQCIDTSSSNIDVLRPKSYALSNMGKLFKQQGELDSALIYLKHSLKIREDLSFRKQASNTMTNIGEVYNKQGRYEEAIRICTKAKNIAEEIGVWVQLMNSCSCLYESYKSLNQTRVALSFLELSLAYEDSLEYKESAQYLGNLEFKREAFQDSLKAEDRKLQMKLSYEKEIIGQKATRNISILFGILVLIIAIAVYSRYIYTRKVKNQLETKNSIIAAEKEKAENSEKAKHQFLANMSHEIRTPMNAIKGMTDILLRREPGEEQIDYLNAIKESSNSLLAIINDILDISKIESGKVNLEIIPFSINDVVQNVKMITQFKAEEKGLEVKLDIDADLPDTVKGDPTRLHQIILNLVGNAIKFTEKGMVTIQVRSGAKDDVGMVEPVFCISDTGVGIGEDRLDKIFESFEQAYSDTTRKFGGTGLGLSISKKLVEIQGGKIWVKSKKGQGSQFYFTIPFGVSDRKPETEEKGGDKTQDNSILKGVEILLVEDNQFNAIVAREELEDAIEDVVVEVAENGVIAVEKVTYGDFDIILMDIQMPVMNGYEATQVIRNLSNGKSEVPIVAMTANVMQEEVEKCYAAGMNDFIGKPFDSGDLMSKIRSLLSR